MGAGLWEYLSNLIQCKVSLPWQGAWDEKVFKVPSNLSVVFVQPFGDQLFCKQWLRQKFGDSYSLDNLLKIYCVGLHNRDVLYSSGYQINLTSLSDSGLKF